MEFGKLKSYEKSETGLVLHYEGMDVKVCVITDEIIRICAELSGKEIVSSAIEGDKNQKTDFEVSPCEDGSGVEIKTKALTLSLGNQMNFVLTDAKGKNLFKTYSGERKFRPRISERSLQLLIAEGHKDWLGQDSESAPVQLLFELSEDQSFFGLGDKTGFLNKRGYEYMNWNTDDPNPHTDAYRALYKSVPFLISKKGSECSGIFFDNTFRSFVDLGKESEDYFFFAANGGNLDFYLIGGGEMTRVVENYTYLTGRTPLPQLWTLGYMQSRWGYESRKDMLELAANFRRLEIPIDSIHFDIDYMDGYRIYTWNEPDYGPKGQVITELREEGIKPILIVDPGVKDDPDYYLSREGHEQHYYATTPEGEDYVNAVWPGESNYPDFGRKEVRDWWGERQKFLTDLGIGGIWNDMNEPASFNGELPENVVFSLEDRKTSHAEVHNVYGHYMSKATYEGLKKNTGKRPMVITRACYAGTQKYSTLWTGDNQSIWAHLQMMIPQLCNLGLSGFSFVGTDIGGFGSDTTPELLTRWIEAAVFSPLFRNHSAKGCINQEPWVFDQRTTDIYRKFVNLRYRFMPYLYDLFYEGTKTGLPIMRPLVLHYGEDPETVNQNGEFLVGENLLVAPVVEQGARKKMVYFPEGTWYDIRNGKAYEGKRYAIVDAPIDECPMFLKEASMIPMWEVRQYVGEKKQQKLTLLTAPGAAVYRHYRDNGEDFAYEDGDYRLFEFTKTAEGSLETRLLHDAYPEGAYTSVELKNLV